MHSDGGSKGALPFFPHYTIELLYKDYLKVVWFEETFSQSRYNPDINNTGSNACTLIAILMAIHCHSNNLVLKGPEEPLINSNLIRALASSILEGNKLYEHLKARGILSNINLTVPEAIAYSGRNYGLREWKSVLYLEPLHGSLYEHLKTNWIDWVHAPEKNKISTLYVVLIFDSRSVLFVIQDYYDTVTLIDSHQHTPNKGALISIVDRARLKCMCSWFSEVVQECYHSNSTMYELSFLYFPHN